jgi:hypothetical protein
VAVEGSSIALSEAHNLPKEYMSKGSREYSIVLDFPCKVTYIVSPPVNKFPVLWDTKDPTLTSQNPCIRPDAVPLAANPHLHIIFL